MLIILDGWRKTTDPRICEVFSDLFQLFTEGMDSGHKGDIIAQPIPYWPGGLGYFEAGRTVKKDLTKLVAKA